MENKICVYAICKNEMKFIDKWLESMQEADYIVVLDTGSTDGSYERLKDDPRITRIEQREISPWRFDTARNESLKLAPDDANIFLCTDFDEIMSKGWAEEIRSKWTETCSRGFYRYAWSHNEVGEPTDVFIYDKIHGKNYEWVFPVHEVLHRKDNDRECFDEPLEGRIDFTFMLEHFQDLQKSRTDYFDLLELAKQENPNSPHIQNLYAREYALRGDFVNAEKEFLALLEMKEAQNKNFILSKFNAYLTLGEIYAERGDYTSSILYYTKLISEDKTYREPYLNIAEIYNMLGLYESAIGMVKQALITSERKYNWVERKTSWVEQADDILSVSYGNLGNYKEALVYCNNVLKHDPNNVRVLKNKIFFLEKVLETRANAN